MTKAELYKLVSKPHIFIRDYAKKNKKRKEQVKIYAEKAIDIDVPFHKYYYGLYKIFNESKAFPLAEKALYKTIALKEKTEYYHLLVDLLKRKNQWWQIVEIYEKSLAFNSLVDIKYYLEYADALAKMNRFEKISELLKPLAQRQKLNSDGYFKYGHALEQIEESVLAEEAFSKAIELDKKNNSQTLGIGIFYEKQEEWISAKKAYDKSLKNELFNADIQYKFGLSLERCYQWQESEEAYLKVIGLKQENVYWYYKLGFVRERKGDYKGAAEAYFYAVSKKVSHTPYWYYRLGYVLKRLGRLEDACNSFLMIKKIEINNICEDSNILRHTELQNNIKFINKLQEKIKVDSTNKTTWRQLVDLYQNMELYSEASNALKELIARTNDFDKELYFSLGYLLTLAEEHKEASEAFSEYLILQEAHDVLEDAYNEDKLLQRIVHYTEYYERYDIEENIILYESYHGGSFSCNPYAMFQFIYKDERFDDYRHVWVINDKKQIPEVLKHDSNIVFIRRNSDLYMRYLAKAKYLINNVSFPEYFIRKEGQFYLNTWHGTPIKTLGKDIKDDFFAHKNVTRNFLHASHLISPNSFTTKILTDNFDINDIYTGIVAQTGYPRQDLTLNASLEYKQEIKDKLGIKNDKPVVLYAPTWRGTLAGSKFDIKKLITDIKLFKQLDINFIFRGHHMAEKLLDDVAEIKDVVVSSSIDTNSLLSIVDTLITDYSSISFDYMAVGKPIIYYTYDREEYESERGLYFPLEDVAEDIYKTNREVVEAIKNLIQLKNISSKQQKAQKNFCMYDDGLATNRVVDLFFFDKQESVDIIKEKEKKSILIYGGPFMSNGITTSLLNLVANIDSERYTLNIVLEPNLIKSNRQKLEQLERLPNNISILGKFGKMNVTLEEKWIIDKLNAQRELASDEMWEILYFAYKREFLRVFGHVSFDHIINFEGYTTYWLRLFAQNNSKLYLHSEMLGEAKTKNAGLYGAFQTYQRYQKLISVSFDVDKANRENLSKLYNIPLEKFVYSDNLLNPQEILEKSKGDLKFLKEEKLFNDGATFINMARLSPEKDQVKLIYAFSRIVKKYSKSKLIILGQGPLETTLKSLVRELRMQKHIFILGQRFNPMPYLKRSDCFVLSSNYEGQGLVLLEAMILGKPVISTDIVGPRSVIEGRPGLLVDNSEEGLYQGVLDFLEGRYKYDGKFNYEEYNNDALNKFYLEVLGKKI